MSYSLGVTFTRVWLGDQGQKRFWECCSWPFIQVRGLWTSKARRGYQWWISWCFVASVQYFSVPWFAHIANYLACWVLPQEFSYQQRKCFLYKVKHYVWEDSFLYKICRDGLIKRCIPEIEMLEILSYCHDSAYGWHFGTI